MRVSFMLVVVMIAGCSKPPAKTVRAKSNLGAIVLQYHNYVDEHQAPPTDVDQLAGFEDPYIFLPGNQAVSSRCTSALRSGDYVVIWSYNTAEDRARNGTVILAYHKHVPSEGGYVAFADGNTQLLNKEQFAATVKAEPTTKQHSE